MLIDRNSFPAGAQTHDNSDKLKTNTDNISRLSNDNSNQGKDQTKQQIHKNAENISGNEGKTKKTQSVKIQREEGWSRVINEIKSSGRMMVYTAIQATSAIWLNDIV